MFAEQPVAIIDIGSNSVRLVVYSGATAHPLGHLQREGAGRPRPGARRDRRARRGAAGARARRARALPPAGRPDGGGPHPRPSPPPRCARPRTAPPSSTEVRAARLRAAGPFRRGGRQTGGAGRPLRHSRRRRHRRRSRRRQPRAGRGRAAARSARSASLPLGVLRLDALAAKGEARSPRRSRKAVAGAGFEGAAPGRPFYMVGGSWRALARLDMALDRPSAADHPPARHAGRPARASCRRLLAQARQGRRPRHPVGLAVALPDPAQRQPAARRAGRRARARAADRLQLRHPRGPALRRAAARASARSIR